MIEVSMITMNCASAMRPSAAQRRGFADCMSVPFRAADRGSTMKTGGRERPSAQGCRAAVAHRGERDGLAKESDLTAAHTLHRQSLSA
jgi:hypothetical protein